MCIYHLRFSILRNKLLIITHSEYLIPCLQTFTCEGRNDLGNRSGLILGINTRAYTQNYYSFNNVRSAKWLSVITPLLNNYRYYSSNKPKALTAKEKLKIAIKDYGRTVIVFHVAISLVSLGCSYFAVRSGLDIPAIIESWGLLSSDQASSIAGGASTFLVAYSIHKLFAPVRISITIASVPFIVRYLRKIGVLKTSK